MINVYVIGKRGCKFFCIVYISAPPNRLPGLILVLVGYICSIILRIFIFEFASD